MFKNNLCYTDIALNSLKRLLQTLINCLPGYADVMWMVLILEIRETLERYEAAAALLKLP